VAVLLLLGPLYFILFLALGGLAYSIGALLRHRLSSSTPADILAFVPLILAVRFVTSAGTVHGAILMALSRGGLVRLDTGRV